MNKVSKVTDNRKLIRYYNLDLKASNVFTKHNDALQEQFNCISNFSSLLPDSLNKLAILADMITDSMTISGRTSLSKSVTQLDSEFNNVFYNQETGTLTLKSTIEQEYSINKNKTFIQTDTSYNIYSLNKDSLLNFQDVFSNTTINIETDSLFFRYTLALTLDHLSTINCINLKLNELTESYPLISEIYYLDKENKRQYCTIVNSSDTVYDLDTDRYLANDYNILINPVKTSRLFITFEDKGKSNLIIDRISLQKLKYESKGSVIFGPVVSNYHILKTAVEASGDITGASFYISSDKTNWTEIVLPNQLSLNSNLNKLVAYNTIASTSIKKDSDVKELYLKVDLIQLKVSDSFSEVNHNKIDFSTDTITFNNSSNIKDVTVYKKYKDVFYGDSSYSTQVDGIEIFNKDVSFIESKGEYLIKSFEKQNNCYLATDTIYSCLTNSKALKIGGDVIDATGFEPVTATVYGFTNTIKAGIVNTSTENNIVILLQNRYVRDTYKVIQNNKEIEIDLRLGFISSSLEVIVGVSSDYPVYLYDSTGTLIKELEIREFDSIKYISLLEEDMFIIPTSPTHIFNSLYPIRLNNSKDFGLIKNSIITVDSLISLDNVTELLKETIPYELILSKENGNSLKLTDTLLRDKYIEKSEETVQAFTENTAIKLRNQDIKKGSLILTDSSKAIKKNYLKEVGFINGATEFKSFRNYTNNVEIITDKAIQNYVIDLSGTEINSDTLTVQVKNKYEIPVYWRHVNGDADNKIEIYTTDQYYFYNEDIVEINYVALNTATSSLYSVDYDKGILYLANSTNVDLNITYSFYNLMVFGRKSEQLKTDKYESSSSLVRIFNFTQGFNYTTVLSLSTNKPEEYTTPFISNIKINYLNTSEQESF